MTGTTALEHRLGRLLGAGSVLSMALFAAGLAALFAGAEREWSDGLVRAGLFVLFGTPFARVAVAMVAYWRARDWPFVVMTSLVLLVLIGGVLVAMLSAASRG